VALSRVPYLVDKSALARMRHTAIAEVLAPLLEGGQVAVTAVLEFEVLYSARNERDFLATRSELLAYPHLAVVPDDFERAIDVMSLLARRGQHRAAGLPDLLQAAVAERHAVTLLHYDSDFDLIAAVTGQPMQWVVPRGSVT
jgi:predicted nucleic acid-binding protein